MNVGGDVNDIHTYPYPGTPKPSASQYGMIGEFGGIGAFIAGKEWVPGKCHTYLKVDNATAEAKKYIEMASTIKNQVKASSASVCKFLFHYFHPTYHAISHLAPSFNVFSIVNGG